MIALIAGTGSLPIEACKKFLADQANFFVIALFPDENATAIRTCVGNQAEVIVQDFYKPNGILTLLIERKTTDVLFLGKVDKQHLLKHLKFDFFAIKLLGSLINKNDTNIMEAIGNELIKRGMRIMHQDAVLGGLLVPPGILSGTLTPELKNDITLGLATAHDLAHTHIGQTVVMKDGMVLALEAIEGTNACIRRGIELGGGNVVVCKSARSDQHRGFDLPTLGTTSLEGIQQGDIAVFAWVSDSTLIAHKKEFIARAQELNITLVSVDPATLNS
jgi:UDP-2,3-diacylglucosamine hydrolase